MDCERMVTHVGNGCGVGGILMKVLGKVRIKLKSFFFFFLMIRRPPRSTLFPYTRSSDLRNACSRHFITAACSLNLQIETRQQFPISPTLNFRK